MSNDEYITIKEAAKLAKIDTTTLYKRMKRGTLKFICRQVNGVEVKFILKADIISIYGLNNIGSQLPSGDIHMPSNDIQVPSGDIHMPSSEQRKTEIRQVIEEFFDAKQNQIMKPIEDQALYIAGKLQAENQFLKEKLETVISDFEQFKNSVKSLPGPGDIEKLKLENELLKEQVKVLPSSGELENKDNLILLLEAEKKDLEEQMELLPGKPVEVKEILLNNADNLKALQKELEQARQQVAEKEVALKEMSQAVEREKIEIVEAWRKKTEELARPWWKLW